MQTVRSRSNNTNSCNVDIRADKKAYTAPVIMESFVDDEGETQHILESGNTISEKNYSKHWDVKKTPVQWDAKGKNPDSRKLY